MSDAIRANIETLLTGFGFTFFATYTGQTKRDNWECDGWITRFHLGLTAQGFKAAGFTGKPERFEFPYFTGLGLRSKATKYQDAKPKAPHPADVLHSLLLDGEAVNQSFNDWCADFGYDNDSIKALGTYQECCKNGETLRKMFTREQIKSIREALQDY